MNSMRVTVYMKDGTRKQFTEITHIWGSTGDLILMQGTDEVARMFTHELTSYEVW